MKNHPIWKILGKEEGEVALTSHTLKTEICHLHDIEPGDPVTLVLLEQKVTLRGVITNTEVAENTEENFFYDAQISFELQETIPHLTADSTPLSSEFVEDWAISRIWAMEGPFTEGLEPSYQSLAEARGINCSMTNTDSE